MRLAAIDGRAHVVLGDEVADLGMAPMDALARWDELAATEHAATGALDRSRLQCPVPAPSQVFAVGLNYRQHAAETNSALPESPMVFTKFSSCLSGPTSDIPLVPGTVDWEVELVLVVGCGVTCGQDISERTLQKAGASPQFSLAKSHRGFGPIGPWVTDEVDGTDLALSTKINGEVRQNNRTSDMVFGPKECLDYLAGICDLRPGDLVFTGTPEGVAMGMANPVWLTDGDVIVTEIEGIGTMTNRCVGPK
jgi:2,4-diketo-3-deoxy-L-fuconate hydrolase